MMMMNDEWWYDDKWIKLINKWMIINDWMMNEINKYE